MNDPSTSTITVAAIGDLHVRETSETRYRELFSEISGKADVLVLAGDLTDFGKTGEAELLAEDLRHCTIPSVGVLGNHDYECGQPEKVAEILGQAGLTLSATPREPSWSPYLSLNLGRRRVSWERFISEKYWNVELEA